MAIGQARSHVRRLLFLALALGVTLLCARARAQDVQEGDRVVEVTVVGDAHAAEPLDEVVTELLNRLRVRASTRTAQSFDLPTMLTSPPGSPKFIARAWIDVRGPDHARLYALDGSGQHVLVRDVPIRQGVDEVAREELAHILEATVETLLSGREIGRPIEQVRLELGVPPAVEPPPPADRAPARGLAAARVEFGAGALWEAEAFSAEQPIVQGPGLLLELRGARGRVGFGARALTLLRLPVIEQASPIGVRLDTLGERVLAQVDVRVGRVGWRSGLGAGVDFVNVAPRGGAPGAAPTADRLTVVSIVRAGSGLAIPLSPAVAIDVDLGCDVDLVGPVYYAEVAGERRIVTQPLRVRPFLSVGLEFFLWSRD
jgi:hypothetical protein